MLQISLAFGALALVLAVPAFAQDTMSSQPQSPPPNQPMSATGSMSSDSMSSMTCDQMMAKAQSMSMSATGARMTMAQNETHMATMAKQKNDEAGCKMHMTKAMSYMK
jgi:hypothetical protein